MNPEGSTPNDPRLEPQPGPKHIEFKLTPAEEQTAEETAEAQVFRLTIKCNCWEGGYVKPLVVGQSPPPYEKKVLEVARQQLAEALYNALKKGEEPPGAPEEWDIEREKIGSYRVKLVIPEIDTASVHLRVFFEALHSLTKTPERNNTENQPPGGEQSRLETVDIPLPVTVKVVTVAQIILEDPDGPLGYDPNRGEGPSDRTTFARYEISLTVTLNNRLKAVTV